MKKIHKTVLSLVLLAFAGTLQSNAQIITGNERFIENYPWKVTLGVNMMDLNISADESPEGASMISMMTPSKLSIAREIGANFSVEMAFSMNQAKAGDYANGMMLADDVDIMTGDVSANYSLGGAFNIPYVDPYLKAGVGYLSYDKQNLTSVLGGAGLNFYLIDFGIGKDYRYPTEKWYGRFGLNFEAVYRENITNDNAGTHLQYSGGVFYLF